MKCRRARLFNSKAPSRSATASLPGARRAGRLPTTNCNQEFQQFSSANQNLFPNIFGSGNQNDLIRIADKRDSVLASFVAEIDHGGRNGYFSGIRASWCRFHLQFALEMKDLGHKLINHAWDLDTLLARAVRTAE